MLAWGRFLSVGAVLVAATSAFAWRPVNPFLRAPANNHSQLMAQVRNDKVVADRFMRHFGMTHEEVLSYFSGLTLTRLDQPGYYPVYNVPGSGELRVRLLHLRAGEHIWVDADDTPVLQAICGNPMTRGPKRTEEANPVKAKPRDVTAPARELAIDDTPPDLSAESLFIEPAMPTGGGGAVVTMPDSPATALVPAFPLLSRPGGFEWLAGIGLLGGAFAFFDSGGEGVIPEPFTIAGMGAGIGFLALRKRRRQAKV